MEAEVSQEGIVWEGWFGGTVRKINSRVRRVIHRARG